MSSKSLKLAVGAVLVASSGPALALDTALFNAATGDLRLGTIVQGSSTARVLSISGATATDRLLAETMISTQAQALCANDGLTGANDVADVFTTEPSFGVTTFQNYAIFCRSKNALAGGAGAGGVDAGTPVGIIKYSGGSGNGINEVANGVGLNSTPTRGRLWVDYQACSTGAAPAVTSITGFVPVRIWTSCPSTAGATTNPGGGVIPKVGISDVEPALLTIPNSGKTGAAAISGGVSPANAALIAPVKGVGVGFAFIVSTPFYDALVNAQGLGASCLSTAETSPSLVTEACMPSLPASTIRSIMTGDIDAVSDLRLNGGAFPAAPSGNDALFVCRRETSSGSQVSINTGMLGQHCVVGARQSATALTAGGGPGGAAWTGSAGQLTSRIFAGNGTGELKLCMTARSNANHYAFGSLSTENVFSDTAVDGKWRYVKIDGVAPTLENIARGKYTLFVENTLNPPSGSSVNVLGTTQNGIFQPVLTAIRTPAFLVSSNTQMGATTAGKSMTGGSIGIPADAAAALAAINGDQILTGPINSQIKSASVGAGSPSDNCLVPVSAGSTNLAAN
jgi:hypothetical protein